MWFAKWFGGRKEVEDKDEPARFAAPERIQSFTPRSSADTPARTPGPRTPKRVPPTRKDIQKGFDPYNSGSFDRNNAWGKIIIR